MYKFTVIEIFTQCHKSVILYLVNNLFMFYNKVELMRVSKPVNMRRKFKWLKSP